MTKRQKRLTKHHVNPRSRGGSDDNSNIAMVSEKRHRLYHQLFTNQTPEEIIANLVNEFWNGDWTYVHNTVQLKEIA